MGVTAMQLVVAPGGAVPAAAFFTAGSRLLALLDEVCDEPLDWEVAELRTGSAVAVVGAPRGKAAVGEVAFRGTGRALHAVSTGEGTAEWSPDAVEAARSLAEHLARTEFEGCPSYLRVVDDVEAPVLEHPILSADLVPFDDALVGRLEKLRPFTRTVPGAVRGRLTGINVSRGHRATLKPAQGRVIQVSFDARLRHALKDALLENVELVGTVKQDADGQVFHIRATGVDLLDSFVDRAVDRAVDRGVDRVRASRAYDIKGQNLVNLPDVAGGLTRATRPWADINRLCEP